MATPTTATERYEQELALLHADEQALRALQERLDEGTRLSPEEETRFVTLQSAIAHSEKWLPTRKAAARKERAQIDTPQLVADLQPLEQAQKDALDELREHVRMAWHCAGAIAELHLRKEARVDALEDEDVARYIHVNTLPDVNALLSEMAKRLLPGITLQEFLCNRRECRLSSSKDIMQDVPGWKPIQPRVIENVQSGVLWLPRAHRSQA